MAKTLQFRRGTSSTLDAITGAEGEIFVDITTNSLRVHDGTTVGGEALATVANATSYADDAANTAYANAISYADDAANTAYANAISYADSEITALNLGTMSTQDSNNVNIDGGVIDGTAIGSTTANTGEFSTLTINNEIIENVHVLTGTTPSLDPNNGTIQTWTLTGNSSPTDSLSSGESMLLLVDDGTAYIITWPTMQWVGGSAPTLDETNTNVIELWKVSTTLYGAYVGASS